ncbi:hypothetical protein C2857_005239 [Epichloe festucae Fl1]|uniref:Phosphoribosyltransferase domain-containing protein n=1 Tax=Epichloe festucae (strain Fl1) TaxID=877507 RepID=A0A7S9KPE5_EPIFF|nr:hypothetical protein C2857_005239 [Epichloe festucae Fl1]
MGDFELCPDSILSTEMIAQASKRPSVIGLYGLPGSGKSFLLSELKKQLSHSQFDFYEGSDMISTIVPGGLVAFQRLEKEQKQHWREQAIDRIAETCRQSKKSAIVTGHFMFWSHEEQIRVYTPNDMSTYTHILYLDTSVARIAEQRQKDAKRRRPDLSAAHLETWQQAEISELMSLCQKHGILFSRLPEPPTNHLLAAMNYIRFSCRAATIPNASRVDAKISGFLTKSDLRTAVVVDADKTLSTDDTSVTFWEAIGTGCPLNGLFDSPLRYSETALLQATLLYEEVANEEDFERICTMAASKTKIHPEFVSLFRFIQAHEHLSALVVTCGIRRVWEKILETEGFSQKIQVIGGARISDDIVVTPDVKARIVTKLRQEGHLRIVAIGDSPLDLPMLEAADQAIVVTGPERNRSRSMDRFLMEAITTRGLKPRQCLLPGNVSPRLSDSVLPRMSLIGESFLKSLHCGRNASSYPRIWQATDKSAAKLLMSPMRDAANAGPTLRKAHGNVGLYLAWEFLPEIVGVEEYPTQHVQGHQVSGYRLQHETQTTIVALMRGGEPMALGLSEALPLAMFVHASCPDDIKREHVDNQRTVILVDSVISSGKTLIPFINQVRSMDKDICIVVTAGVVQDDALSEGRELSKVAEQHRVSIGALRLSKNKFVGSKGTDTGHRLFNTTHMA